MNRTPVLPMSSTARLPLTTGAALVGFAANSLLCRAALGTGAIDAWSFTAVRLASGALVLTLVASATGGAAPAGARARGGRLLSALALWVYAGAFSLAYLRLHTGVGALVLFACVQATMIGWSVFQGNRPNRGERVGFACAFAGLVVLTLPGATLPDPLGLGLMALSGVAWGIYSLRGRSSRAPLVSTRDNFVSGVPLAVGALLAALLFTSLHASEKGLWLAAGSGGLASGLGYSLWYLALPRLTAVRAALVQLLVPILAAAAGVLWLDEALGWRLLVAGPLVLGGVALALLRRAR